ncbi:bifunctional phosphopantothenoylcysteine decarboxylase/phosphopantothenate--cysteine ligase CoaBC [Alkalicoccus urumqiensis]|uniref:Coenzyme A biosynthesis bifunctional protein CoaBC n=1 Tax=Alkalicoccus urumqiensis TaxID=1548213 RepID=A0A2P6MGB8_ALKUR|nr:bifunctional phosphopantothenoylcysteine decarboxylase/phosphopantothenate--cysteine ligase CoaBC [Alkalicoccus urumqiensis]PRO65280.1 bifunctional phosphopantothenoylcysteine decarboxylase/phosphopantothenate--cysteine ligase CoaBC [Alkalicoccus urumqiensis]
MLETKRVLLAVSGGIAAFKAAALTSKLVQAGFSVKVMMTKNAEKFISPLTFQALSREPVYTDTFEEPDPSQIAHIDIADWADVILCAPASADLIAKMAGGHADDMVTTTLLASTAPVYVAPAMNVHMYAHPAVKRNMDQLKLDGCRFIEPDEGYLACGYTGKGRMAEPEDLLAMMQHHFIYETHPEWHGKKVLVTAGPTREVIDPVRYISNRSSGKMGFALAEEAAARGAHVILIAGPSALPDPHGVTRINVTSAEEMKNAVLKHAEEQDIIIKAAAVSDYRPEKTYAYKVKKTDEDQEVHLERTTDILLELGKIKKERQTLIGFAAESDDLHTYAVEKLKRKNADMICANSITTPGGGFEADTNALTLFFQNKDNVSIQQTSKKAAAKVILDEAHTLWREKQ